MKLSIKFLVMIAFLFTMNFAANAQQRGGGQQLAPEQMAERETARMVEQLNLDDSQATKVKEVNLIYAQRLQEAREDNKGNREAMKEIGTAINAEKSADIKLILTTAQVKTYEDLQAQHADRKGKGGRRGNRGSRG